MGLRARLDTEARGEILRLCRRSNPDRPVVQFVVSHHANKIKANNTNEQHRKNYIGLRQRECKLFETVVQDVRCFCRFLLAAKTPRSYPINIWNRPTRKDSSQLVYFDFATSCIHTLENGYRIILPSLTSGRDGVFILDSKLKSMVKIRAFFDVGWCSVSRVAQSV
jgi:hypothetical protein